MITSFSRCPAGGADRILARQACGTGIPSAPPAGRRLDKAWLCFALVIGYFARAGYATAGEPEPPTFVAHTADGHLSGTLRKIADDWSLRLGGPKPALVAARDVIAVRRQGALLPHYPHADVALFANGDRLRVDAKRPIRLEDDELRLSPAGDWRVPGEGDLRVPINRLAALSLAAPEGMDDAAKIMRRLLTGQRGHDEIWLKNGDRVEGGLLNIDAAKGCVLKVRQSPVTIPWKQIAVLAFNTELRSRQMQKEPYGHVVSADGSRLAMKTLRLDAGGPRLTGQTLFGAHLELPVDKLVALDIRQGRAVYLSDLRPKHYEHTPFLGLTWPLAGDAGAAGGDLRLAGQTFDKGLGMHTQSSVTYALDGHYRWFEAQVGVDDVAGRRGRARIRVLVDGEERELSSPQTKEPPELTAADAPLSLRISVHNARELTLEVLFGRRGDVQGHVHWADARLIRE